MQRRYIVWSILGLATIAALISLAAAIHCRSWDAATTFATLFVGLLAADMVVWQGYLIKQQIAFSTYLDLDKGWNTGDLADARKTVHAPGSEEWEHSRLEGILEFFEKLSSLFQLSGDMPFIYESTLGWYAGQYFLFAREHGQIKYLRKLWDDDLYEDLENLYAFYRASEARRKKMTPQAWEQSRLATEDKFWEQERKD